MTISEYLETLEKPDLIQEILSLCKLYPETKRNFEQKAFQKESEKMYTNPPHCHTSSLSFHLTISCSSFWLWVSI